MESVDIFDIWYFFFPAMGTNIGLYSPTLGRFTYTPFYSYYQILVYNFDALTC